MSDRNNPRPYPIRMGHVIEYVDWAGRPIPAPATPEPPEETVHEFRKRMAALHEGTERYRQIAAQRREIAELEASAESMARYIREVDAPPPAPAKPEVVVIKKKTPKITMS